MSMRKERYWLRNRELVHGCPNVCHAAIGSENFVARTVQTGPPAPGFAFSSPCLSDASADEGVLVDSFPCVRMGPVQGLTGILWSFSKAIMTGIECLFPKVQN